MTRAIGVRLGAVLVAWLVAWPLVAQDAPAAVPALTTEQKLSVRTLAQQMEIAQLKAQAAQRDFDLARAELLKLLQSLQRDGYDLDLQSLVYVKRPEKAPQASGDDRAGGT